MTVEKWNRLVVVQFNETEYRSRPEPGFYIQANVVFKGKKQPEATIVIYNVSKDTANKVLGADRASLRVRIMAGYSDVDTENPPLVFDGNIIRNGAIFDKNGDTSQLKVEAKEGAIGFSRNVKIYSADGNSKAKDIFTQLIEKTDAGVPTAGELGGAVFARRGITALGELEASGVLNQQVPAGTSFSGHGWEVAQRVGDTFNCDIVIRRGFLEFYDRRKPRTRQGPLLSQEAGNLLERPKPMKGGKVKIRALLEPDLIPGDRFRVETDDEQYSGVYVVMEHAMSIDSGYGGSMESNITARLDP